MFSITVAGQKIYIVTSPEDISAVYKNPQSLTFDGYVKDMYAAFGMSSRGVESMFAPIEGSSKSANAKGLPSQRQAHLGSGIQKEQLHPGRNMEDLVSVYLTHIKQQMYWEKIPKNAVVQSFSEKKVVSLRNWAADVIGRATVEAYFGRCLIEREPNLLDDFRTFEANSWMLLYRYPRMFAKPMYESIDKGTHAFTRYFQLPFEQRSQACHYIRTVEMKQRKAGMTDRDIGIAAHTLLWAAHANASKICFWLLAHIICNPTLLVSIRKEVAPAFSVQELNTQHLIEKCPILDSSLNEILRLTSGGSSARTVESKTVVGNHTLFPNAKIIIPYRQLHYDETVFGSDAGTFNPYRFLQNKDLHKSPFFKPYGGGVTYCSGRFLARKVILTFTAVILNQYELKLEGGQKSPPRLDLTKPTLGVMDPIGGEDVLVEIRPRASLM